MVWLPDDVWAQQKGKGGGGKSSWTPIWQPMFEKKGGWGKGWGKGKGKTNLRVDPSLKVWIGNLAESTKWKELQEHMTPAGTPKWVEVFSGKGKGTGAVVFATAEEAQKAIETLNGSTLEGQAIVVDTWVKAEKPPEDASPVETL
mmetsp:Transcript_119349/g.266576  ORF Transcript_119349/g.266576 Transcript_119349/m.266576 type:complete len:145 (-) Transcript_119349:177-611(-)